MQTFLPYPQFDKSLQCLDWRRLGKQRVEALQLLRALGNTADVDLEDQDLSGGKRGWANHPAARMWRSYEGLLAVYHDGCINEWVRRGYQNTMRLRAKPGPHPVPAWMGRPDFHASHRSNLLRKLPAHYGQFGWQEPDTLPYVWPA
jgi:hypothetical protein